MTGQINSTEGKGKQNFSEETFQEPFTWKTEGCGIYPSKVECEDVQLELLKGHIE